MEHMALFATQITTATGNFSNLLFFLYLGPETVMPLASILASILGVLLIFWRFIWGSIKRMIRIIRRQPADPETASDVSEADSSNEEHPTV
jgi:hypothetical protein